MITTRSDSASASLLVVGDVERRDPQTARCSGADLDRASRARRLGIEVAEGLVEQEHSAADALTQAMAHIARGDAHWRRRLLGLAPARLPLAAPPGAELGGEAPPPRAARRSCGRPSVRRRRRVGIAPERRGSARSRVCRFRDRRLGAGLCVGLGSRPVRRLRQRRRRRGGFVARSSRWRAAQGSFALDLPARDPAIPLVAVPDIAIAQGTSTVPGACLTVCLDREAASVAFDSARLSAGTVDALVASLRRGAAHGG